MEVHSYEGKKFHKETPSRVEDLLTVEQALKIIVNDEPFTITMRTPGNDIDLVRGLLFAEDIYRKNKNLEIKFSTKEEENIVEAYIKIDRKQLGDGYLNSRNLLSVSSCGICGKTVLDDLGVGVKIENTKTIRLEGLYAMFQHMKEEQVTFHQTGGSHAAGVFTNKGNLLLVREDIGRHNAVDKVIGALMNDNLLDQATCLTVSGRVSYEIITKAFAAKIPVLAAVSAPSSLAVDFAKELGITLLGFCRENKATCYAHPYRIT